MKSKSFIWVVLVFLFSATSLAQEDNGYVKFSEVYDQLGFTDDTGLEEKLDNLRESLVGKEINWTLTLESV